MTFTITPRADWNALPVKAPYTVPLASREYLFVHYLGAEQSREDAAAQLRSVQKYHIGKGWADIGYNFAIDNATGQVFEARGRDAGGAHCPGFNKSGIGVLVMIGEGEEVSDAAKWSLATLRYVLEVSRDGAALKVRGHRDGKATACPGDSLYAFVQSDLDVDHLREKVVEPVVEPVHVPCCEVCTCPVAMEDEKTQGDIVKSPGPRPPVLRRGAKGPWVSELQRLLNVGRDGDFGPNTERWVRLYQGEAAKYDSSVVVDGVVGPQTWKILYNFRGETS